MSADPIARGLALQARPVSALAQDLISLRIPASIKSIRTTGYSTTGSGVGTYVTDSLATSALAAAHPHFCKQSGDGRYWRLYPGPGGVLPEQAGAVGSILTTDTSNQRVPIQAASDYALYLGVPVLFTMPFYSYWQELRTAPNDNYFADETGLGFRIGGGHAVWRSARGRNGTRIKRRAPNGGDPAVWANWPLLGAVAFNSRAWRGGGFYLRGTASAPADDSQRAGLTVDGVILDGGLTRGSNYGAMDLGTGDGWDGSDQGIKGQADRYKGDLVLMNGGTIGFRGEGIYMQGGDHVDRTYKIRDWFIKETNATGLNTHGGQLDIDGLVIEKVSKWAEAWGGGNGKVRRLLVRDSVNDGHILAGIPGLGLSGGIGYPTRYQAGVDPVLELEGTFINCGTVFVSNGWTHLDVTLVDTGIEIGNNSQLADLTYGAPCHQVTGSITLITDQENNIANMTLLGGQTAGKMNTDNIDLKVRVLRSEYAAANAYAFPRIYHNRSLGSRINIELDAPAGATAPAPIFNLTDFMPNYSGSFLDNIQSGAISQNVQTTPALDVQSPIMGLSGSAGGIYNFTVPGTRLPHGAKLRLMNNSGASYNFVLRPSGDGIDASEHQVIGGNDYMDLVKKGFSNVCHVTKPPKAYAASAAPTAGTWARGATVKNNAPASAGHIGWVATAAGTPGTWATFGPIT